MCKYFLSDISLNNYGMYFNQIFLKILIAFLHKFILIILFINIFMKKIVINEKEGKKVLRNFLFSVIYLYLFPIFFLLI